MVHIRCGKSSSFLESALSTVLTPYAEHLIPPFRLIIFFSNFEIDIDIIIFYHVEKVNSIT